MSDAPNAPDTVTSSLAAHAPAWFEAGRVRRSRRRFDGQPCEPDALDALDVLCLGFRPYGDARIVLVRDPGVDVFHGIVGSYGKVTGAPHVLLFIADERSATAHSHAGYLGEAAILEATVLGLDTCWVGGFFHPRRVARLVERMPGERVVAVSPVGRATDSLGASERSLRTLAGSHDRKPLEVIAPGIDAEWPEWARAAVSAARIAPSAMNRQPWRFRMDGDSLVIARDAHRETPRVTRALDCGIAMLHAELGAHDAGVRGAWIDAADGLDIARFVPGPA